MMLASHITVLLINKAKIKKQKVTSNNNFAPTDILMHVPINICLIRLKGKFSRCSSLIYDCIGASNVSSSRHRHYSHYWILIRTLNNNRHWRLCNFFYCRFHNRGVINLFWNSPGSLCWRCSNLWYLNTTNRHTVWRRWCYDRSTSSHTAVRWDFWIDGSPYCSRRARCGNCIKWWFLSISWIGNGRIVIR